MAAVDLGPSTTDLIDEDDQPLPGGDELDSADDATADLEQINENGDAGSDQGLFGDEDDEALDDQPKRRTLDDEELDSGDDADRNDRQLDDQQDELDDQEIELNREGAQIATHALPHGDDGELYVFKVPKFLGIEPTAFNPSAFQSPTTDHHSKAPPSTEFSAHKTAMTTLRWRRSPRNASTVQSNARILRWSDGSLTLQLATDPATQYLVPGKPLAPVQMNPRKPTPTSAAAHVAKARKLNAAASTGHKTEIDSFTYLSAASVHSSVVRTTNKITTGLTVQPSKDASDDAVARLQTRLAASKASKDGDTNGILGAIQTTNTIQDPELAQKQATKLEKEVLKQQRRREQQEMREKERSNRVLGRRGGGAGGLTVGALEDEDELGMGIRRAPTGARKPKKRPNRTGEIYSDDEDIGRGRTREDEYDEEDDFVAPSDEDEEVLVDDDEDDIDEQIEREERARGKKRATPDDEAENLDAEGGPDDAGANTATASAAQSGSPLARSKRRRVIEDDDEE